MVQPENEQINLHKANCQEELIFSSIWISNNFYNTSEKFKILHLYLTSFQKLGLQIPLQDGNSSILC